jgi:hypothetical protein
MRDSYVIRVERDTHRVKLGMFLHINDLFKFSVVSTIFAPIIGISETFLTVQGRNLHLVYFQLVLTNSSSQIHAFFIIF